MSAETALVIIDVQIGQFHSSEPPPYHSEELLARLKRLIEKARASNIPVIFIQHEGRHAEDPLNPIAPGFAIHPAVAPHDGDTVVRKRHPDAFQETSLHQELSAHGITKLVIAGLQTEYCVDTTVRRAYSLGYKVTLVEDGHSTWDSKTLSAEQIITHHNSNLGGWFANLKPESEIYL